MTKEEFNNLSEELRMGILKEIAYDYAVFVPKEEETALPELRYSTFIRDKIFFDKDALKNAEYGRIVPYNMLTEKIKKMAESYYRKFDLNVYAKKKLENYGDRGENFKTYFKDCLTKSQTTTQNAIQEELFKQLRRENDAKAAIKAVGNVIKVCTASVGRLLESLTGQMNSIMVLWNYEDMGYSQYRINAIGENCEACQSIDGEIFKIADAVIGKTLAPFHPNCNCAIEILDSAGNVVFTLTKNEKPWEEYLKSSLKQLILGNYTDDVNLLGTLLQITAGLLGVDLSADIRDLFYDVTNFELTKEHILQTLFDSAALLPIVGGIKYADEASALMKSGAKYGDEIVDTAKAVNKATDFADFPKNIHPGRQGKHIVGNNNYKQQILNGKNPSILTENPNKLLREWSGKGKLITPTKERVDFGMIIGKYYDSKTGKYYDTTRGIIHYDAQGTAHIVPSQPANFNK